MLKIKISKPQKQQTIVFFFLLPIDMFINTIQQNTIFLE